jgi:hypothetical protein
MNDNNKQYARRLASLIHASNQYIEEQSAQNKAAFEAAVKQVLDSEPERISPAPVYHPVFALGAVAAITALLVVAVLVVRQFILPPPIKVALVPPDDGELKPAIVVLDTTGTVSYTRQEYRGQQTVSPGTQLATGDLVFSPGATLRVLCPDGTTREFSANGAVVDCPPADQQNTIIAQTELQPLSVQKGGKQDLTIPYLIAPRATLVRTPNVTLTWNAPPDILSYTLTVRAGTEVVWSSEKLPPEAVTQGNVASIDLPVELKPDLPYTVEICFEFTDLRKGCTTDPGLADANVAFYYHDVEGLGEAEQNMIAQLGQDTPESFYARAALFSQPLFRPPTGEPIGLYQEALELLHQMFMTHPDSALAQSPEPYILRGELYRRLNLPIDATLAFRKARELASPTSESAALAAIGEAATTPASSSVIGLYDQALEAYGQLLNEASFTEQFKQLCVDIGSVCLNLEHCQDRLDECLAWSEEGGS